MTPDEINALPDDTVVTRDLLNRCKSERGGWNDKTLRCFGLRWPLQRGWYRRLVGQRLGDVRIGVDVARAERIGKDIVDYIIRARLVRSDDVEPTLKIWSANCHEQLGRLAIDAVRSEGLR